MMIDLCCVCVELPPGEVAAAGSWTGHEDEQVRACLLLVWYASPPLLVIAS